MHPRDAEGQLPVNLRHDVFVPRPKDLHTIDQVEFHADGVKLLAKAPKEFARLEIIPLQRAATPQPIAREITLRNDATHSMAIRASHTAILTFNDKKQSFELAHQTLQAGHPDSTAQHFNASFASLQSHFSPVASSRAGSANPGSSFSGGSPAARSAPAPSNNSSSASVSHYSSPPPSPPPSAPASSNASSSSHR
jgi:hypothetical protein